MRSDKNHKSSSRGISQDRRQVAAGQPHEVEYMARKMHCSEEEVISAICEVGNDRDKVEQYIRSHRGSSR